jgi:D-glycero-D-manno-heptose 1,7-bisphosphate phosphatase
LKLPTTKAAWERAFDGLESFGLASLLVALPLSEAAKSIALALAVAGFAGRIAVGGRYRGAGRGALAALGLHVLAAAASVAVARGQMKHPGELLTLGMVVVLFPITADVCARPSRRLLFGFAILAGAAAAALVGYGEYMVGDSTRLALPSIENAVPAGEYLGAAAAFGVSVLLAELAAPLAGPLVAFAVGALGIALLMTKSRGPLIGAAAGCGTAALLGMRRRHAAAALAACALAAVLFVALNPESRVARPAGSRAARSRGATWSATVDLIAARPILGHGLGSFPDLGVVYSDDAGRIHQLNAHSAFLNTACETGLLGCGALVLFVVLALRDVARAIRGAALTHARAVSSGAFAAVIGLLVAGVFSVSTNAEPGMLMFVLLALGAGASRARGGAEGSRMAGRPAVFLDRDGTITVERGHVTRPEDLTLIEGAGDAIRALNDAGILAVVVSNQSGVARGLMSEEDLDRVHRELERLLLEEGARLDAAYYCPNYAGGADERYTKDLSCRKPATGMIERAVRERGIDLPASYVVGDSSTDVELSQRAGIPGVLVMTGKGAAELTIAQARGLRVAHAAPDLASAVRWVLADMERRKRESPDADTS